MSETAADLVDRVLPRVPVRQWVLTIPWELRFRLARDTRLLSGALQIFVAEVFRFYRRRSGVRPVRDALCGAVTGVQRFGGALNLNVHFHTLALDGIYVRDPASGELKFRRVPPPTKEELKGVLGRAVGKIHRYLERQGCVVPRRGSETRGEEYDPGAVDPSVFEVVQAASIREWIGLSEDPRKVPVLGRPEAAKGWVSPKDKPNAAAHEGFTLHAGVRMRAGDKEGLEKLCRYVLRPPFSEERLERLPDGRVLYGFRRPRADGTSHLVLTGVQLVEKLAALVAPPRAHYAKSIVMRSGPGERGSASPASFLRAYDRFRTLHNPDVPRGTFVLPGLDDVDPLSEAIRRSGGLNRPLRRAGGEPAVRIESLEAGSARV